MKQVFSVLAGLIALASIIPYAAAILRRKTKPSKTTWIIWATLDSIILTGMWVKGAVNGQVLAATIGGLLIAGLALNFGTSKWKPLDIFCLCAALFGIVLWQVFDSPEFGVVTSLLVMFIGSIPTFVSAWEDPTREDKLAWTMTLVSSVFTFMSISRWTLMDLAQPVVYAVIGIVMAYILYVRAWALKRMLETVSE